MDQARSALSFRIFSMLTSAAPGSTSTSSSGYFFLMTSAVAAAIGVQVPPVGPAEKTNVAFDWGVAGPASEPTSITVTASIDNVVTRRIGWSPPRAGAV